jgi:hypothetical protein
MSLQNGSNGSVSQPRRPYGSYQFSIERRAVVAVGTAEQNGWPTKQAAGLFSVCPAYVDLVRRLGADDRLRLVRGELRLAQLHKDYRQRLAERRAQRLAAKREAEAQAEREALNRTIDSLVGHFGVGGLFQALDVNLQRQGQDIIQVVIDSVGADRAVGAFDKLTQPQLPLAAAQ